MIAAVKVYSFQHPARYAQFFDNLGFNRATYSCSAIVLLPDISATSTWQQSQCA